MEQMAQADAGFIRVSLFYVARELVEVQLLAVLDDWNTGDEEQIQAVYVERPCA